MSWATKRSWQALGLLAALLLPRAGDAGEIVAAGAVSLRGPLTEIARGYEQMHAGTRVQLTFGASSFLAAQLRAGAPIDVFVSADARIVDDLVRESLVDADERVTLARNRLVVMARPGLSPVPRTAEQLDTTAIRRLAMPDGAVPVGRYAREWLARRGLLERLLARVVLTEHARATLAAVDAGHADVAIVYATDARLARTATLAFAIPAEEQPEIVYAVTSTRDAAPGAAELVTWMSGDAAREILARAGFDLP